MSKVGSPHLWKVFIIPFVLLKELICLKSDILGSLMKWRFSTSFQLYTPSNVVGWFRSITDKQSRNGVAFISLLFFLTWIRTNQERQLASHWHILPILLSMTHYWRPLRIDIFFSCFFFSVSCPYLWKPFLKYPSLIVVIYFSTVKLLYNFFVAFISCIDSRFRSQCSTSIDWVV